MAQLNTPSDASKPSVRGETPLPGPRASGKAGLSPNRQQHQVRCHALSEPILGHSRRGWWPLAPLGNAVWLLNSEAPDGATICDVHLFLKSQKTWQLWLWSQVVGGGASRQQLVHLWPWGWDPTRGPGSGQQ